MTQEERRKYFKFYRGEDRCPEEWCGQPRGIIWGAEREAERIWPDLVSGEWGTSATLEGRLEEFVSGVAGKFDPFGWTDVMEFYSVAKSRED